LNKLNNLQNLFLLSKHVEPSKLLSLQFLDISYLKSFNSVHLTTYLYPYNQTVTGEDFTFSPYEEYVDDITHEKRSSYRLIERYTDKIFGLFLGIILVIIFLLFDITTLYSVESVVSIFAAYSIGKELWKDIENALISVTKSWKLRFLPYAYHYIREDFGTIQEFWRRARITRDKQNTLLPTEIDFITHSNSKTIEMLYTKNDFQDSDLQSLRIISINPINEIKKKEIKEGYMFGIKLMLTKKLLFLNRNLEIFQAVDKNEIGAIDLKDKWHRNAMLIRTTYTIGQWKLYYRSKLIDEVKLIKVA
jgi:hypothetical protein